ncbi:MAG TPA: OadG family protein [Clostridiales bacterium]|jgi:Na+-transporting methylmalonyl-CoA/oxaloacetate decarboxylase gamma subunit|nr:OadG family protein [Clostridiales bacterium]
MSLAESLLVSGFSMTLVFFVLVALFLLIVIFSKVFGKTKAGSEQGSIQGTDTPAQPVNLSKSPSGQDMSVGTLQLKKVDEKTAAMIMAIVSHESEVPLSELRFKSIKLIEENN